MENVSLKLSKQESEVLLQLLDIAVKSAGLNVAEAGVIFAKRIQELYSQEKSPEDESEPESGVKGAKSKRPSAKS